MSGRKEGTADFVLKKGHVSVVRIAKPVREVLRTILDNGIAHHASVAYSDYLEPLRILAKIQGWKVIE